MKKLKEIAIEEIISSLNEKESMVPTNSRQRRPYKWNKQNYLKYTKWAEKKRLDPFDQDTVDQWKELNVESKLR